MQVTLSSLLTILLATLGPAGADKPQTFMLKQGDQIVAIGDSITQAGGYLRNIDAVLAQQYPDLKLPKIVNVGISGQKAEDLVKRFEKDVVARKPAVVTLSIGINDVWHRLKDPHDPQVLARYRENVAKMVDQAQAAGIKVVLLTPTVIQEDPAAEGNRRLTMYVEAMRQIAAEKKCRIVNLHGMFLNVLEKKPKELAPGAKGLVLTSDGVHMNRAGDALMAIGVLRALGVPDEKIALSEEKK
jgi:lysophospholipase L1-like esterase